ncbi:YtxH domain-containing protein [Thermomonospora amylolytica]|uniref:YtxH domain-containing protein n=1 Tax=Thermomonospora amylolytica TaxID=1411117 RepID=UPI000E6D04FF|nr:YtxH domain-containing protein [Thermomonospora amylolytica]
MKIRIPFLVGAAVGYVLGTKAGRERYEQIVQQSRKLAENPKVQETAETLRAKSGTLAGTAKNRIAERTGGARQKAETTEREPLAEVGGEPSGRFSGTTAGAPGSTSTTSGKPSTGSPAGAPSGTTRPTSGGSR